MRAIGHGRDDRMVDGLWRLFTGERTGGLVRAIGHGSDNCFVLTE